MTKRAKTGGRKKGVPNKATQKLKGIAAAAVEAGSTPLEYMLTRMRDENADRNERNDMAKAAAPYVHPKLTAVEHAGKDGGPMDMNWTVKVVHPPGAKTVKFEPFKGRAGT